MYLIAKLPTLASHHLQVANLNTFNQYLGVKTLTYIKWLVNILTECITLTHYWHKIQIEPHNSFSLFKTIYVIPAHDV